MRKFLLAALLASTPAFGQDVIVRNGDAIGLLGDSITVAGGREGGYGMLVKSGLAAHGIKVTVTIDAASGANSQNLVDRSATMAISRKPRILTISCGVNDGKVGGNQCPIERFRENISTIIDKAQKSGIEVLVLTTTAWESHASDAWHMGIIDKRNEEIGPYNDCLREIAKAKHCPLVDMNSAFQAYIKANDGSKGFLTEEDGIHPGQAGHRLMALTLLRAFGLGDKQLAVVTRRWDEEQAARSGAAPSAKP
jgi:lysophospholipase L1-like esterase